MNMSTERRRNAMLSRKVESFKVFSARKKILELGDLTWHESVVSVTFTILVRNMFCDILLSNIFWDIQEKILWDILMRLFPSLPFYSPTTWNRAILEILWIFFFSKWIILRRGISWFSFFPGGSLVFPGPRFYDRLGACNFPGWEGLRQGNHILA